MIGGACLSPGWRNESRSRAIVIYALYDDYDIIVRQRSRPEALMCQTTAYVIEGDREILLLQDVISITPEDGALHMVNLFGEEKIIPGKVKQIDLLAHKILIVS